MRKMLVVLAALLLAAASAQGAFVISLTSNGLSEVAVNPTAQQVLPIDLYLSVDAVPVSGTTDMFAGIAAQFLPLPAGWTLSGLTYNTVDFDNTLIVGTDVNGYFGIGTTVGYNTPKKVLSFTLTAAPGAEGEFSFDPAITNVPDLDFNTIWMGAGDLAVQTFKITPEPATALLLIGALPFLRRRRA